MKDKPLPAAIDLERFVLGAIMVEPARIDSVPLTSEDFSLDVHKRIWRAICDCANDGYPPDRGTIAVRLQDAGELENVGGLSYLVSLDDGMPRGLNLDGWVRTLREKAALRKAIWAGQHLTNRALLEQDTAAEILAAHAEQIAKLSQNGAGNRVQLVASLSSICERSSEIVRYLIEPELPEAAVVAITGDAASGKSSLATAWARDLAAGGRMSLLLDRDNPLPVLADRFRRLQVTDESRIKVWDGSIEDPTPMPDDRRVIEFVKETDPKPLVVIDSLSSFHGGDENDAGEMRHFMNRSRMIANLGATVLIIHHEGKSETSKDYRGSSDFKAAVDVGFHCSNLGADRLDKIRLRCFKSRFGFSGSILYRYADGRFNKDDERLAVACAVNEQLTKLLRDNPRVSLRGFEKLAMSKGIARAKAKEYLDTGIEFRSIHREFGTRNSLLFTLGTVGTVRNTPERSGTV